MTQQTSTAIPSATTFYKPYTLTWWRFLRTLPIFVVGAIGMTVVLLFWISTAWVWDRGFKFADYAELFKADTWQQFARIYEGVWIRSFYLDRHMSVGRYLWADEQGRARMAVDLAFRRAWD